MGKFRAKILLVDDDESVREVLKIFLEEENYFVVEASDGKIATQLLKLDKYDLIISDVKMPNLGGIELLHWVKKNIENYKFIMVTGFSDLIFAQEALDIGAHSFINKPFNFEELDQTIQSVLQIEKRVKPQFTDDQFSRIDLSLFVSGSTIPCSLFIRIREDHFVKLAQKGDPIPRESIDSFKNKNVKFLHVLKEEYAEFLGFNIKVLKTLETKSKVPSTKISSFLGYVNDIVLKNAMVNQLDRESMEDIVSYSQTALDLVCKRNLFAQLLSDLASHSDRLFAHSMGTATLSYLMARKLGWSNEPTLFKIFLAGILHDIGLKDVPETIIKKPSFLRSEAEQQMFQAHPRKAMEMLNEIGDLPEEVILAAYQHHEDCAGKGYPQKLRKSRTTPISRLISVADMFDEKFLTSEELSFQDMRAIFKDIEKNRPDAYDREFMLVLKDILKVK